MVNKYIKFKRMGGYSLNKGKAHSHSIITLGKEENN